MLAFVRTAIGSVWALELLLLLRKTADQAWADRALIGSLRANARVVNESLAGLTAKGLVTLDDNGRYRYRPASATLAAAVESLAELYGRKPMTVTNAILSSRNDKIHIFADAFRFRN